MYTKHFINYLVHEQCSLKYSSTSSWDCFYLRNGDTSVSSAESVVLNYGSFVHPVGRLATCRDIFGHYN